MPFLAKPMKSRGCFFFTLAMVFLLNASFLRIPEFEKADLLGDINPERHRDFDKLRAKYCSKTCYLREEVYDSFKKMWKAADADGVRLIIVSATRNRIYQKGIWNRKWLTFGGDVEDRAKRILEYSSMPGTSRHHWGTDFDLNSLENQYFETGQGAKVYQWLQRNAADFGFFQPYTSFYSYREKGYREEKWHWSYFPTASRMQRAYRASVQYPDLRGFMGDQYAESLSVINNYVLGVESWPGKEPF
jgi:D-alanyl-D-alanine carboxypeptidase